MEKHKSLLLLLLIIFSLFILLNQKRKLKGGLKICKKSNIINNFNNKKISNFINSYNIESAHPKLNLNNNDLKSENYQKTTKAIEDHFNNQDSTADQKALDQINKNLPQTRELANIMNLSGGSYSICDTNDIIINKENLKKYSRYKTLDTLISDKKKGPLKIKKELQKKIEEQKRLMSVIFSKKTDFENKLAKALLIKYTASTDNDHIKSNIFRYHVLVNYADRWRPSASTPDSDIVKFLYSQETLLDNVFLPDTVIPNISKNKKVKILRKFYQYLFKGVVPLIISRYGPDRHFIRSSRGLLNNYNFNTYIIINKQIKYSGVEYIKTYISKNSFTKRRRKCLILDLVDFDQERVTPPYPIANYLFDKRKVLYKKFGVDIFDSIELFENKNNDKEKEILYDQFEENDYSKMLNDLKNSKCSFIQHGTSSDQSTLWLYILNPNELLKALNEEGSDIYFKIGRLVIRPHASSSIRQFDNRMNPHMFLINTKAFEKYSDISLSERGNQMRNTMSAFDFEVLPDFDVNTI